MEKGELEEMILGYIDFYVCDNAGKWGGTIANDLAGKLYRHYPLIAKELDALLAVKTELSVLQKAIREYLERPSTDGRPDRQEMRRQLAEMVK